MPWQLLIILHSLLAAIGAVFARQLSKNGNKYGYAVILFVFAFVWILGIVASQLIDGDIQIPSNLNIISLLILEGFLFPARAYIILQLYRFSSASIGSIINTLSTLSAVLFASVLLNEKLNFLQWLGATCMIFSIYIASSAKKSKYKAKRYSKALIFGVLSAVMFGIAITSEKYLLDNIGVNSYLVFGWGAQFIFALLIAIRYRDKFKIPKGRMLNLAFLNAVIYALAGGLFIASLVGSGNASQVASLSGLKIVLTVLLAYVFLRERQNIYRIIVSSVLAFFGLYLLFI